MKKLFFALCLTALLSACAAPVPKPAPSVASFQRGITTEADVVAIFGKPMSVVSGMDGGKVLAYATVNNGLRGATFIPIVGLFAGGVDMKISSATFTFSQDGRLSDYKLSDTAYSADMLGRRQPERE